MAPEAIFDILEVAVDEGVSVPEVTAIRRGDAAAGGSKSQGYRWEMKLVKIYDVRRSEQFKDVQHLNLAADPSTHDCKEYMIALAYSWEINAGSFPLIKRMPGGRVTPNADTMTEEVLKLAADFQLERMRAFREMQAWSAMSFDLVGRRISDYVTPRLNIKRVQPGEARMVLNSGDQTVAYISQEAAQAQSVASRPNGCATLKPWTRSGRHWGCCCFFQLEHECFGLP